MRDRRKEGMKESEEAREMGGRKRKMAVRLCWQDGGGCLSAAAPS